MKEEMIHVVKKDKKKLLILGSLAVAAVFLMIFGNALSSPDTSAASSETASETYSAALPAAETELERLLSSMAGVGKVEVIISDSGDITETYAYNEERSESVKEDGSTEITEKKELVLIDGDNAPVVTKRVYPAIEGVLVVAEGASDDTVRENVLRSVASYLDIGKNRIEITAMEVQ